MGSLLGWAVREGGSAVKGNPRTASPSGLAHAIRRGLAGERVVDPELAAATLNAGPNPLTARERDVLAAAVDGSTIADIAGRLHLSESTVRDYLSAAIGKTGSRPYAPHATTAGSDPPQIRESCPSISGRCLRRCRHCGRSSR